MSISQTKLSDVSLLELTIIGDTRSYFIETWNLVCDLVSVFPVADPILSEKDCLHSCLNELEV